MLTEAILLSTGRDVPTGRYLLFKYYNAGCASGVIDASALTFIWGEVSHFGTT
jgi:hypothetical protein